MKAHLSYREGLQLARTGGALAFGSLVHDVLDRVYTDARSEIGTSTKEGLIQTAKHHLRVAEETDRATIRKAIVGTYAFNQMEENYGLAELLLAEYFHQWEDDLAELQWVSLEETFEVWHRSGRGITYPIRGKFDGVFRSRAGKLWLFETKTKSRIEEDSLMDNLPFNLQVMLYLWAINRVYGERPAGVLYNVMRRPQLKRGVKETLHAFLERVRGDIEKRPEFYFKRYEATISQDEQEIWETSFEQMLFLVEQWARGEFNFKNSDSCMSKFGTCEYLSFCSRGDLTGLVKRETVFPELQIKESTIGSASQKTVAEQKAGRKR